MSFKPLTVPTKTLLVSMNSAATSFRLNNIKGWDNVNLVAGDFGTVAYCVFRNASRTRVEIMEFDPSTIANTSITIVRRGLDFDGDLTTEISANKLSWTKGDTYVDLGTDAPQVYQWLKEYADSLVGGITASSTNTLTNKRITKRTGTTTSSATPTINTDNVDEYYITAQTTDITSFTTNLSGAPVKGDDLFISIIGTAARAITWGASFGNGPVALPTTTVTTTELSVLFKYDGSIWRCYASGSRV